MKSNTIELPFVLSFLIVFSYANGRVIATEDDDELSIPFMIDFNNSLKGCFLNINNVSDPQPLFLLPHTELFYPFNATGFLEVDFAMSIELFCTSGFAEPLKGQNVFATCVSGQIFAVNGVPYNSSSFVCKSWPEYSAEKSGQICNGGTTLVYVGFALELSRFVKQFEICFDENEEVTRYVFHKLEPGSNYFQANVPRLKFATNGFFGGKDVDNLYKQETQKTTIGGQLGGEDEANKYFDIKKNLFLARGHMSAKVDHFFGSQQRATFTFLNAAPQWQVFNAGNWQRVENGLRSWVSKEYKFVDCYTGVYGVSTLPDSTGNMTPLYLSYDENNNGLIPVPKIYFRVVIEPSSKLGVVLIGVNNPHLTLEQIKANHIICPDVGDNITWLNWKRTDIRAGYSYACEVDTFTSVVKHLPKFDVIGLLQ